MSRFTVINDSGADGTLQDRYAIFDTLGDGYVACKTIGTGKDDLRYTMLTREEAELRARELNIAYGEIAG